MADGDAYPWSGWLSHARRGTRLPDRRNRRPGASRLARHALPQRLGPQRSRRPVVSPLVRRRRHDLGHPLRRSRHPLPQPLRRDGQLSRRDARRPHRQSRLRQAAAGRRAGQRFAPAGQRLQHLRRDARWPVAVAVGGRPALRPRSGHARYARHRDVRRHGEGLLGPSQGRSRRPASCSISASTTAPARRSPPTASTRLASRACRR